MGRLLSQVKHKELYKVFNTEKQMTNIKTNNQMFFDINPNVSNIIDFIKNPDYKLDGSQWFFVDYSKCDDNITKYIENYFKVFKSTASLSDLTKDKLEKISFLIYGNDSMGKWKLNFQTLTKASHIRSRDTLDFSLSKIKYEHKTNILEFKDYINLHIDENTNRIYFKNFGTLKAIHKDFINLYKKATATEVKDFIKKVNTSSLFNISTSVNPLEKNLKKIKYILDNKKLTILSKTKDIKSYIGKYSIDLVEHNSTYEINSNKELTEFIKIIDESYYESEITKEKRETNSTKAI